MRCDRCKKPFAEGDDAFVQDERRITTSGHKVRMVDHQVVVCKACSGGAVDAGVSAE